MAVGASKYGTSYRAPYTLDFTPPPAPAGGNVTGAITSAIDAITGLPVGAAVRSGGIMPLLLIGGLLYLVSR
jgi:hypothetical protein